MYRFLTLLVILVAVGGWFIHRHYEFEHDGFERFTLKRRVAQQDESARQKTTTAKLAPQVERDGNTIHVASFNIQVFGTSKASKPHIMEILAEIVRRFDVVAVQEVRAKDQNLLPNFVQLVNATGRHYDFVIGPRLGRTSSKEQYAFIYDAASIEVDRDGVYTVDDPDDLLHRQPLVAWFRVRGPPANEAFTFKLVNIHTDPDETDTELNALDDVFLAVSNDGSQEDDIILLGDLNVDDHHLGQLGSLPGIAWMISGAASNTLGTKLYDNIIYKPHLTTEFTGRAGVFDVLREFNLTTDQALEVSDHLPVWAEFSVREGAPTGPLAARPGEPAKK